MASSTSVYQDSVLPTHLKCHVCGLNLTRHADLDAAGLGGVFSCHECESPLDHYRSEVEAFQVLPTGNRGSEEPIRPRSAQDLRNASTRRAIAPRAALHLLLLLAAHVRNCVQVLLTSTAGFRRNLILA